MVVARSRASFVAAPFVAARFVAVLFVVMALPAFAQQADWLKRIRPFRTGDTTAYHLRESITAGPEHLMCYLSWAPPRRAALIICDAADGLPLLVVEDGEAWLYDPIGGQILFIRAEAELRLFQHDSTLQSRYGVRADFPDEESRMTINIDPAGVLAWYLGAQPDRVKLGSDGVSATVNAEKAMASVRVAADDPRRLVEFTYTGGSQVRHLELRFDSIVVGGAVPAWHHAINRDSLMKFVPVVSVSETRFLSDAARKDLATTRQVFMRGGMFILREALRDADLRKRVEENSPVLMNFTTIGANDIRISEAWRAGLKAQGVDFAVRKGVGHR